MQFFLVCVCVRNAAGGVVTSVIIYEIWFPPSTTTFASFWIVSFHLSVSSMKHTGWTKKNWDLEKFKIALTHSILKLKSIVIPLNQMSQSGEKHAQD